MMYLVSGAVVGIAQPPELLNEGSGDQCGTEHRRHLRGAALHHASGVWQAKVAGRIYG